MSLKRVSADDVKGLGMKEGPAKFKLPSNLGDMGGGLINAKVRRNSLAFEISSLNLHCCKFAIIVNSLAIPHKICRLKFR